MPLRVLAGLGFSFLLACVVHAEPEDIRTTYNITGSSATVQTSIKKASAEREKLMRDFLFPVLAEKLKSLPLISGIEFDGEVKPDVSSNTYSDYWEYKRSYPAMIRLALPSPVTLMVKIEESFRSCKSPAEKAANATSPGGLDYHDGRGGSSSDGKIDCALSASVKVKGPVAVYGNFASGINLSELLRDKQSLSFEVTRSYSDKTSMSVTSKFMIDSEIFDRNLFKFLATVGARLDSSDSEMTRNSLLVGTARIMRLGNEKVVAQ